MPRKVSFHGNTITLNDHVAEMKVGDRVRYIVHDWMEGEHTVTGELISLGTGDIARVKIGAGFQADVVHDVPKLALTVIAPVIPLKGGQS